VDAFPIDLERQIMQLPARQRECLLLYYVEGYTQQEIAKRLGCARQSVSIHLARARARLRTAQCVSKN
jgi:RNA polymerase sigma factor (sigma-70 family)